MDEDAEGESLGDEMNDEQLMALILAVDPMARRIPPGIREIASAIETAERERWAKAFDAIREKTLAAQSGPDHELANVMLRQVAELGFGECVRALRS